MKDKIITIIGILFIITGIIICVLSNNKENEKQNTNEQTIDSTYKYLYLEPKGENIIYSPLSINTAFAMLNEGARDETKKELDKLFSSVKVNNYETSEDLSFANSIFINEKYKDEIKQDYVKILKNKYNSEVIYDTFSTTEKINSWINNKTFGLIKNALDDIDSDARLALVNALALNVKWKEKFNIENTYDEEFYLKDGKKLTQMMHNTYSNEVASYYKTDKLSAVKLDLEPINNIEFEFLAIMPDSIDNYEITKKELDEISNKLIPASSNLKLKLSLPKFKFDYKLNIMEDLKTLGVKKVFTPYANLDGIGKDLYVSEVVHKATIDLKEEGLKASATTVIVIFKNTAMIDDSEYINIDFNKPFIFIIRDKKNSDIWFVGKVVNPIVEE